MQKDNIVYKYIPKNNNVYCCVYDIQQSEYDREFRTYDKAKEYAEDIGIYCYVYSPNKVLMGVYDKKYHSVS